jgi:hypothetical protein
VVEINNSLPAPFLIDSDIASENNNSQVTFRIPSDSPRGFIEMIQSPWNPDNVIVAVLGNTSQGVQWAAKALIEPLLRSQLGGNFAEVDDRQIFASNPIYSASSTTGEIGVVEIPSEVGEPLGEEGPTQVIAPRPGWILPVIGVLIGLIVLVVLITLRRRSSNIPRGNADGGKSNISSREDPKD